MTPFRVGGWLAAALALLLAAPAAAQPFSLGIFEGMALDAGTSADQAVVFQRMAASGARFVRTSTNWNEIAPSGQTKPPGFQPRDPADPHYDWTRLDAFMRASAAHGLEPIVTTMSAPRWAEGKGADGDDPAWRPSPAAYKDFAIAMAKRYSGSFADPVSPGASLPRLRYYQAWNEPNFNRYLTPLRVGDKITGPALYVGLLNAFYNGVKSVNRTNKVVGAGMGPFGYNGDNRDMDPQVFIRGVFCLKGTSARQTRARRCGHPRAKFDIWAQHPYTLEGTPTTRGISPDAGAMGNVPAIKRTLDRAVRLKTLAVSGPKQLWITELDWMSDPPGYSNLGKPLGVHAQYLSEAAYRLWRWGAGAMIWYELRDQGHSFESVGAWPGGLYFAGSTIAEDRPKPALRAFKLPFYSQRTRKGVYVWALVEGGPGTRLRLQRTTKQGWRTVKTLRADKYGVLSRSVRTHVRATYRVRTLDGPRKGLVSYPFASG